MGGGTGLLEACCSSVECPGVGSCFGRSNVLLFPVLDGGPKSISWLSKRPIHSQVLWFGITLSFSLGLTAHLIPDNPSLYGFNCSLYGI